MMKIMCEMCLEETGLTSTSHYAENKKFSSASLRSRGLRDKAGSTT